MNASQPDANEGLVSKQAFRLGTNTKGYAFLGGLLLVLAACLGFAALDLALTSSKKVQGAGDPSSITVAALGAALLAYLGVKTIQIRCVASRDGLVIYNRFGRVRRIDARDITSIVLRTQSGRAYRYHVPAVTLTNGKEIKINALALGRSTDPPVPEQLSMVAEISSILRLPELK